jgi:hypothetical protein
MEWRVGEFIEWRAGEFIDLFCSCFVFFVHVLFFLFMFFCSCFVFLFTFLFFVHVLFLSMPVPMRLHTVCVCGSIGIRMCCRAASHSGIFS